MSETEKLKEGVRLESATLISIIKIFIRERLVFQQFDRHFHRVHVLDRVLLEEGLYDTRRHISYCITPARKALTGLSAHYVVRTRC